MKKITTLILAFLLVAPILLTYPFKASSMVGPAPATITVFVVDENNSPLSGATWNLTGDSSLSPSAGADASTVHTVDAAMLGGSYMVSGYPSAIGNRLFNSIRTSDGPGRALLLDPGQNKTVTIQYASGPLPCTIDMKGNDADSVTVEPGSPVVLTWNSVGALNVAGTGFDTGGAVQNTSGVTVNPTQTTVYTISNVSLTPSGASRGVSTVGLQEVLNSAGYLINTASETGYDKWNVPSGTNSISFTGKYLERHSPSRQAFGYYVNSDISTFLPVWKNGLNHPANVPILADGDPLAFTIPTVGVNTIGFARYAVDTRQSLYASEAALNSGGLDQAVVFNPSLNKYILGFSGPPYMRSSRDYGDGIIELQALSGSGTGICSAQVEVRMNLQPVVTVTSNLPSSWALLASGVLNPATVSPAQGAGVSGTHTLSVPDPSVTLTIAGIQDIPGYSYAVTNTQGTTQTMTFFDASPSSFSITYMPTGVFNFSVSPASDISVSRNPNQSAQVQQPIVVNYVSGAATPLSFTASNLPTNPVTGESVGVSYAGQGCVHQVDTSGTPPCTGTLTLTVPYSIPVGTYPITVAVSGEGEPIVTTFNLIVQPDLETTVSCTVSPTIARVGESVTWTANPPGGAPNPFVFTWTGTDFPTIETANPFVTSYQSTGVKTASFSMTNGLTTATCPAVTVYVGVVPDYREY
jgi:hypothetical protein